MRIKQTIVGAGFALSVWTTHCNKLDLNNTVVERNCFFFLNGLFWFTYLKIEHLFNFFGQILTLLLFLSVILRIFACN